MRRDPVQTDAAPAAIGTYSQAIITDAAVYLSGQIPLRADGSLVEGDFAAEVNQVFDNLNAVASAAGARLTDAAKLTVYLTDLANFDAVNAVAAERLNEPYPARAAIQVAALPRNVRIEIDAIIPT